MIYLACPYAHPDPDAMEQRFDMICRIAGALMARGHAVFSPIAHSHPIQSRSVLPMGWGFWSQQDLPILAIADRLIVAAMDGWCDSAGVKAEIQFALDKGKRISVCSVDSLLQGALP